MPLPPNQSHPKGVRACSQSVKQKGLCRGTFDVAEDRIRVNRRPRNGLFQLIFFRETKMRLNRETRARTG
jgi:hypothetical protein